MELFFILCFILSCVCLVLLIVALSRMKEKTRDSQAVRTELSAAKQEISSSVNGQLNLMQGALNSQISQLTSGVSREMNLIKQELQQLEEINEKKLESMRTELTDNLTLLRQENTKKLDEIRGTVDEKLQTTLEKRIHESFQTVNQQLEAVYKSLGEMQTLATDVGGLKKVLSGVKTRGILGEIQLGAILEEILSPEQYETNVATIPGSKERVEYAVRLPGTDENPVYLPIDSKFPGDTYAKLLDAREAGDKEEADRAYKALEAVLKSEAKDIHTKYVAEPYTTNFGILFLPFEGLYAEVVNHGLVDVLQRDYRVSIAGPSTMAALLNSLQMGFRTLAIQKRSGEVWEVLGAVKTEFGKFGEVMKKMQGHLNSASEDLEKLMTTRSNTIERKLRDVQSLEPAKAADILQLSAAEDLQE